MERVDDVFRLYCADLNVQSTLDFIIWDEYLFPRSLLFTGPDLHHNRSEYGSTWIADWVDGLIVYVINSIILLSS